MTQFIEKRLGEDVDETHCCFCGEYLPEMHRCNPYPLMSVEKNCCHECDAMLVLPARFAVLRGLPIDHIRKRLGVTDEK